MNEIRVFFIIILLIPSSIYCQESLALRYGDNHESHISVLGEVDNYHFDADSGDIIMLRMRDETLVDSYIKLYNPEGKMIKSAWSDGGLAKIKDFKLEDSGQYTIKAYDRNHNDVGKYGISLHKLNEQDYAIDIPEIISFEDSIRQIVGANVYRFQAEKDDVLFTIMRALTVHLECEFFIYDSEGNQVYRSLNKGRSATVGPVILDKSDSYSIVVTDRGGNDLDKFGITHMLLNQHESIDNLNCSDNASDNLEMLVERKCYRLLTQPGQIPLVEVRSNNIVLETTLEIYDEKGELISRKSDTNKLLSEIIPASDEEKSYLIVVYDRNGNDFGDFGVQVQFLDDSYCPDALSCTNPKDSITISGLAQNRLFSIQGVEGEPVNVVLKEKESILEPHIRVFNLNGELLFEKYDGVKADLSNKVFPYTGKFLLLASDRSGNDLGNFEITAPAADLSPDISNCKTVFLGIEEFEKTRLKVIEKGDGNVYKWNTGATTSTIEVSPIEDTNYSVTVTNAGGCSGVAQTYVEVVDSRCGNGNGAPKVEVCHVKNNGQHQTLCISINGAWDHLYQGIGHEDCHLGPCDFETTCDQENNLENRGHRARITKEVYDQELLNTRSKEIEAIVYPNPTSDEFHIALDKFEGENVSLSVIKFSGEIVFRSEIRNDGIPFTFSFGNQNLPEGIYLVKIDSEVSSISKSVIYLK